MRNALPVVLPVKILNVMFKTVRCRIVGIEILHLTVQQPEPSDPVQAVDRRRHKRRLFGGVNPRTSPVMQLQTITVKRRIIGQ